MHANRFWHIVMISKSDSNANLTKEAALSSQLTIDPDLPGGLDDALGAELTAKAKTEVACPPFRSYQNRPAERDGCPPRRTAPIRYRGRF
jgi:hypothetical protein